MTIQRRILLGYVILLAVIASMAAIFVHERQRIRETEAESAEIRQVRRDINAAHRLRTDRLLQALKPHCRDYVRPAQIDTLRTLLAEKEAHLLHLTEILARQDEADSLLVNHLPEVARRATRIRTVRQKKSGLAGHWEARKPCRYSPLPKNCTGSATA